MFEFFKKPKQEQVAEQQENREEITRDSLLKRILKNRKTQYLTIIALAVMNVALLKHGHEASLKFEKKQEMIDALDRYGFESEEFPLSYKIPYEIREKLPTLEKIIGSEKEVSLFLNDLAQGNNAEHFLHNFDSVMEERMVFLSSNFDIPMNFLFDNNPPEIIKNTIFDSRLDAFIEVTKSEKDVDNKYYTLDLLEFVTLSNQEKDILQDPDFIQGAKIAKELDMSIGHIDHLKVLSEVFEKNPDVANQVKMLKQKFNISISTDVLTGMLQGMKIDVVGNKQLLELLHGEIIRNQWTVEDVESYKNRYSTLAQDPVWRLSVKKLLESGFGLDEILEPLLVEKYKSQSFVGLLSQIKHLGYGIRLYQFVQQVGDSSSSNSSLRTPSPTVFEYYRLDTEQGCEKFLYELKELNKINPYYYFTPQTFISDVKRIPVVTNMYADIDKSNPKKLKEKFIKDPALQYIMDLGYDKRVPDFLQILPELERKEWVLRTVRNMHIEGVPATEDNFKEYLTQTVLLRSNPEFTNMDVFKGRNVLCLAHNEDGGERYQGDRFFNDAIQESILAQSPHLMEVYKGDTTTESLISAKSQFLDMVSKTKKMTIYFDGHGSEDNIYLSDGSVNMDGGIKVEQETVSINTSELAESLIQQSKLGDNSRVIMISHACFSQNFIRTLYEKLEAGGVKKLPIIIGMSEYGQYSYSSFHSKFNDEFFEGMLKESSGATKIQDIIDLEQKNSEIYNMPFNISIFFPIKNQNNSKKGEIHWQIAEAEYLKNKTDENNPVT